MLVHPQFSHDDVVYGRGDLPPREPVAVVEFDVRRTQRYDLQVLPPEFRRHGEFLPALPPPALAPLRHHRRMMGHLFADGPPAQIVGAIALVRLPQQRIERFACARTGRRIRGDGEGGHVSQLFAHVTTPVKKQKSNCQL